jgi:ABC-2 type transport system ATP-binding protein
MTTLLEVKNLVKKYDDIVAVNGVSFSIEQGACFGLLGPNGAGKTTTIEVIEDIIRPNAGEILYKGQPRAASFREQVGIQFQQTALLSFLTVYETLETFQSLFPETYDLQELIELCHLQDFQHQYNDRISGGQRQRFMLALALVNRPELVFLDEPSTGLDPQARRNLWDVIQKIKNQGKTVVLTTHYMEEAQHLCNEIAIMDDGQIIAQGSPEDLILKYCSGVTVVLPKKSLNPSLPDLSMQLHEVQDRLEINTRDLNKCLQELIAKKVDLGEMTVRSPKLEDVFLNLTGHRLRD